MRVARGKVAVTSDLTVDADIAMATHILTGLGAGDAAGKSVRYQQVLREALGTTQGDILLRGASVFARFAKIATGKVLMATATGYEAGDPGIIRPGRTADFQEFAGEGTATNPERINNDDVESYSTFDAVNEYIIIYLQDILKITQYRIAKDTVAGTNDDAEIKIQYWDVATAAWVDWVTGVVIPQDADEWMTWDNSGGEVNCSAIKIICTKLDTGTNELRIQEIELKY